MLFEEVFAVVVSVGGADGGVDVVSGGDAGAGEHVKPDGHFPVLLVMMHLGVPSSSGKTQHSGGNHRVLDSQSGRGRGGCLVDHRNTVLVGRRDLV